MEFRHGRPSRRPIRDSRGSPAGMDIVLVHGEDDVAIGIELPAE
jgi:hypothetical protein